MIPLDSETCGFHGPAVIFQYAYDRDNVIIHEIWFEPIKATLELIEEICEQGVMAYNLAFDWFHVQKLYNCLDLLGQKVGDNERPIDHINLFAELEPQARDGLCIKPSTALDLMLYARKGPFQSLMDRKNITIKRVPKELAAPLAQELENRIVLKDIYFEKSHRKGNRWEILPVKQADGKDHPYLVDIKLKFKPSTSLKSLAYHALGRDRGTRLKLKDVEPDERPYEVAWAPFALAVSNKDQGWAIPEKKNGKTVYKKRAWPAMILDHALHWRHVSKAREYAKDDITDLLDLYDYFGQPEPGDDDSILACMMGSIRWKGYRINTDKMKALRNRELVKATQAPKAPSKVYLYVTEVMSDAEKECMKDRDGVPSTKKAVLEEVKKLYIECPCCKIDAQTLDLVPNPSCENCSGTGKKPHPAAQRAKEVAEARAAATRVVMFNKLLQGGRLHPAASVIGSLSGRMSGRTESSDGGKIKNFNALGIPNEDEIRECFDLADNENLFLCGGDFDAYEVAIAEAVYSDPELRKQLLTCNDCGYVCTVDEYEYENCAKCGAKDSRRKIHGLFAMEMTGMTYEQVLATKGTSDDWYKKGKSGFFSQMYGGDWSTLVARFAIEEEKAKAATTNFRNRFAGVGATYKRIYDDFCSMRQKGGIGTKVEWHEPKEYVESLNGFRRMFTLENMICKALFHLAENLPKAWDKLQIKVVRRDREQRVGGAVRSALYAAAFAIQAQNMRAALNHLIQSTGAIETKRLQIRIWEHQPVGATPWKVMPLGIHDEVMCPTARELIEDVRETVRSFIKETKTIIPLLKMEWGTNLPNWAEK